MKSLPLCLSAVLVSFVASAVAAPEPLPFKVPDRLPDRARLAPVSAVHFEGFLGERVSNNARNRLLNVSEEVLLGGFRKRPGSHPWIGEHVGKFLHAATLAWANTNDPALKAKIDRVAAELVKCQEPDGYLGTYTANERWTSWDVWVHKYNLVGLLTYHQYTGDRSSLEASRRIGDLLINTFGPGKRDIIASGTHVGMAATSVLEPMVLLYRLTADDRYLQFCKYLVRAYDQPNGPRIVQTLSTLKRVDKTANAKAYEMLSNLVGLCELARVTGDRALLAVALNAWEDVVANHLYITGSASQGEHFHEPHDLPNAARAHVAETCVTTTWIQLTLQLLRLTGEARFGAELERTLFNHLAAAQRPDGAQWCYFTPLDGRKEYGPGTNCCVSSGPRGMALAPFAALFTTRSNNADVAVVNLLNPFRATISLNDQPVTLVLESPFPRQGGATLRIQCDRPAIFALLFRVPDWACNFKLSAPGDAAPVPAPNQWALIPARPWKSGDRITIAYDIAPRLLAGQYSNQGLQALLWGPFVLAYDEARNPGLPPLQTLALAETGPAPALKPLPGPPLSFQASIRTAPDAAPRPAVFIPFADAGATGGRYRVWLPTTNRPASASLLSTGEESRSRAGNVNGQVNDDDPESFVVTFNNTPANEDWFAVTLDAPVTFQRIVCCHGRTFHDGGWFDASAGKPRIQVQRTKNGPWETIGALDDYPATTAADSKNLKDGQPFTLRLNQPVSAIALRVIGKPASGDSPAQSFSSCAELQAFPR